MNALDAGLLLIRLTIGLLTIAHGTRKLFGWFGGAGFTANAEVFDRLGFRPGRLMALMAGLCEAGGGALLVTGLIVPLAGAMLLGSMINAAAVQSTNGFFFADRGMEYPLVLASVATALVFTGPGQFSLGAAVGWNPAGWTWGVAAAVAGGVGAAGVLLRRRIVLNPG